MVNEDALKPGTLLQGGKYKIVRVLGQGGFGITYKAKFRHEAGGSIGSMTVESVVAIKEFFLKSECEREENSNAVTIPSKKKAGFISDYRKKFIKEANNLAKLNHKHIVKVIDIFEENATAYFVMEHIAGESLDDVVYRQGAMSENDAVGVIEQLASAVDYVHSQRMMHLDIKPANILIEETGELKLIDFGLAKHYDSQGGQTSTGATQGVSEGYSPIEQYKSGGVSRFCPQTDIYSIGATLAFLLTGKVPPSATTATKPELPSKISSPVRQAVDAAMNTSSADRPKTVEEFMGILGGKLTRQDYAQDKPISSEPKVEPKTPSVDLNKTKVIGDKANKREEVSPKIDGTINRHPGHSQVKITKEDRGHKIPKWLKILSVIIVIGVIAAFGVAQMKENGIGFINSNYDDVDNYAISGTIAGHDYVDLGLPSGLKWATCNVGASTPSDYGDYFAWGETTIKSSYTSDNCKTWEKNIGNIGGNISYDAARANWGSSWRLPTQSEFEELLNNCTWTWTSQGGHNGYKVKSKKNGNSIFLPAAGLRLGSSLSNAGDWGYYWSSTPNSSNTQDAFSLNFDSGGHDTNWYYRGYGQGVRAVSE